MKPNSTVRLITLFNVSLMLLKCCDNDSDCLSMWQDCGLNVHEKYLDQVPKTCTKYKSVTRDPTSEHLAEAGGAMGGRDGLGYSFDHRPQSGEEQDNISYQVLTPHWSGP